MKLLLIIVILLALEHLFLEYDLGWFITGLFLLFIEKIVDMLTVFGVRYKADILDENGKVLTQTKVKLKYIK